MKSDRTFSIPTVRLSKRKYGIVAANATTNAREGLTRRIVARAATETICITEFDDWRICEGGRQRRLVIVRRSARNWESLAGVALEDDVSRTLFEWVLTTATEEECQTAGLVSS
jgi:hypothetical protein